MTDTSIPKDWVSSTIGDVCALNPKVKLPDDLEVGFMPMSGVPTDFLGSAEFDIRPWEQVKKGFTQFKDGDVIFAKITPCFENGKAAIIGGLPNQWGSGSTEYYVLRPYGDLVLPRLLFALVKTKEFLVNGAVNMSGSVGHKRVPKDFVSGYQLPLPPLAEQKVIADKLDTLLAQVEATKARLERIPKILKRFRQSVLTAAVSGRLGGEHGFDKDSWPHAPLTQLCLKAFDGPFGSKLKSSDYVDSGVGVVRLENIKHLRFDETKKTFITKEKYQNLAKNKLEKNDLLFSSFVDEEVRACLFPFDNRTFINKADCFCIRVDKKRAIPKFVLYFLTSRAAYSQIVEHVQGVTRPRVNLRILKSLELPVPTMEEQSEIVRRADQLFAYADLIDNQVNNALVRINNLSQSILAKAFRGELTEQWRKDNPDLISGENSAEALLQRINAEREQLSAQKPKRQKRSKQ